MRCLPISMAGGPLLAQVIREARQDTRFNGRCRRCGAHMPVRPDRPKQRVRCPSCLRVQDVEPREEETPWRLTASAAEALRRTRSWIRWVGG